MTKRIFSLILALLMAATLFAACGEEKRTPKDSDSDGNSDTPTSASDTPTILGAWNATVDGMDITYEYLNDGKCVIYMPNVSLDGTYEINDNKLTMTQTANNSSVTYEYALNGDTLSLTGTSKTVDMKKTTPPAKNALSSTATDEVKGVWETKSDDGVVVTITFNGDGNGEWSQAGARMRITYTTTGGNLSIVMYNQTNETKTLNFGPYTSNGNTLDFPDGTQLTKK